MLRTCLTSLLAVASAATVSAPAQAVAYVFGTTTPTPSSTQVDPGPAAHEHLVTGFDGSDSLSYDATRSSGFGMFTGSQSNVAAAPSGDTSQYVAIGAGGRMAFDLRGYNDATNTLASISVFVGSVDTYNFIDILGLTSDGQIDYGSPLLTVSGADLIGAAGGHPDGRLTFGFSDLEHIGGIVFRSSGVALEFDSIAVSTQLVRGPAPTGAVPEPASWAMMLGGFGMIGGAMRARRRTAIRFA